MGQEHFAQVRRDPEERAMLLEGRYIISIIPLNQL